MLETGAYPQNNADHYVFPGTVGYIGQRGIYVELAGLGDRRERKREEKISSERVQKKGSVGK